jgi:hypothetical protein
MSAVSPLLFRLVSAEYSTSGVGTQIKLSTDLPGNGTLAVRETITLPPTTGRAVLAPTALSGATKGHIFNVEVVSGNADLIVYRIGFYLRRLGRTPSDWQWHWISVVPTGDAWDTMKVPIPPTPEEWSNMHVPVPPTPEDWQTVPAIPATSTEQHTASLPMDEAA